MMKKIFLSAIVIISFIGYVLYIQVKRVTQTVAIVPAANTKKISSTPTITSIPPTPTTPVQSQSVRPTVTLQPIPPTATPKSSSLYKDGTYMGAVADAFYGNIQVQVTISGGKITNVQLLQAPNDRDTSIQINQQADPMLAQEAIQNQSANVDIISGATDTSQAFMQSIQQALSQAKS